MITRRHFLHGLAGGTLATIPLGLCGRQMFAADTVTAPSIASPQPAEDVFAYIRRHCGRHDAQLYACILGAANEVKEGDAIVGVAAADGASRIHARSLLAMTPLEQIDAHALHPDALYLFIQSAKLGQDGQPFVKTTLGDLKNFLLSADETQIKQVMPSLSSDVIACVVKLMTNDQLIQVGSKVFNPLPGSQIGAKGYLGARIQPNSPTDNLDDIIWQVFDGWSYAVGDVLLGTNPVSSEPASVREIQRALQHVLRTFGVSDLMPHCVLSHIDVQAEVEALSPGSTALWFQSIAGCEEANTTFGISVEKMQQYARQRTGPFGLYFETGQGADFTNGHGHGFDMVVHESRKYGFARALTAEVAAAQRSRGGEFQPWIHVNDVAGFIGPEVFRSREQLVRCCLEDIVMGKLHGLCLGLDVCSTLHMDISLDDLNWCLDQIMPACPAYLMALPTKIDPMLGYLTTGFQDHVRLRRRFGYRVNDPMWKFFQSLGVIDTNGRPTEHFGDPLWVYLQYCRRQQDTRSDEHIFAEGRGKLAEVRQRGLFIAEGYGEHPWDLQPELQSNIQRIYEDAKLSIWAELREEFIDSLPDTLAIATMSDNRTDYILHPVTGEMLSPSSITLLKQLSQTRSGQFNVQIMISDGLNALAIMEPGQLLPFLTQLRADLTQRGLHVAPEHLIVRSGRVRAGYRIGETLFGNSAGPQAIVHIIGERPGTGHRTFSVYITAAVGTDWRKPDTVDHNITKVVSGIAFTAFPPSRAADQVARLLGQLMDTTD